MVNRRPGLWWKACWMFITPTTIIVRRLCGFAYKSSQFILFFTFYYHTAVTYNGVEYPAWGIGLGWIMALCSMAPLPIVASIKLWNAPGATFGQKLRACLRPADEWGPSVESKRDLYRDSLRKIPARFAQARCVKLKSRKSKDASYFHRHFLLKKEKETK